MRTSSDPAEMPEASMCDHPADHALEALCSRCGHPVDACCPECGGLVESSGAASDGAAYSNLSRAEFYRRFVLMIHNARNSKFTLGCYMLATGDGFADGVTETEFARAWGVGKATVSKQCRMIIGYLGISPSRYMRREEVARKFRLANRRPQRIEQRSNEGAK